MEETKERNLDLRSSKPDVRTDRRHKRDPRTWEGKRENNESGLRMNGPGQVRNHADVLKQPRDVEMQQQQLRRHDETEWKRVNKVKSGYKVRPGERICRSYLQTGLCDHGTNCLFNHPTCKFFRKGYCKDGSDCKFIHAKNNEAPRLPNNTTMRQALSSNLKILAEFSHPKERDGAEPMPQVISSPTFSFQPNEKEQRQAHEDPQEQRGNTEWQRYFEMGRRDAQDIVQKYRQRNITDSRRYFEMGMRDGQEIVQRHRQRETSDQQTQENVQEHRQRDITERQRYFEMGRRDGQEIVQQHRQRETSGRQRYLGEEKSEEQEQRLMATTSDRKFDERKHQTESSSMAARKSELVTSLQSVFKDDIAAGYKRTGIEHGEGGQRVEVEEIVRGTER
ncbi:putative zinc finger CCCH domain-containing protein 9 [Raphanus sativus]|uniref:Zinc finger CCCH domain-containing protein 9 n=1 Tax=Raphanus sativus TaxID=3726 RepID=A0A9W3BQZ4_RAPSA|nr:putative zinc finger CCCH domain-containing protein 9 [Raphanus sativus]